MTDYSSPTIVTPGIPLGDINPVELVLLTAMFEHEHVGGVLNLFEEQYLNDMPILEIDELRTSLAEADDGRGADYARAQLSRLAPGEPHLQVDEEMPWEQILQDIVRRSETLDHIEVITSYVCSKMRSDGFGGAVIIITADNILSSSTDEMACALLDRAQHGEIGRAPGFGYHIALQLSEPDVRLAVNAIIDAESPTSLTPGDVTADDIRAACGAIVEQRDFSQEYGELMDAAARSALHAAIGRQQAQP